MRVCQKHKQLSNKWLGTCHTAMRVRKRLLEMIMFGLFKCTYDYYEWMDIVCVAKTRETLVEYCEKRGDRLVVDEDEHEKLKDGEYTHFHIREVTDISV